MSNEKNNDSGPGSRGCSAVFLSIMLTPLAMWGAISAISLDADTLKIFATFFFFACSIFAYKYMFTENAMIEINKKVKEKEIKKNSFYYFCNLTDGNSEIGVLEVRDLLISIKYKDNRKVNYNLSDVRNIEIIQSDDANFKQGIGAMALGGALAGPLGAAAGASVGRLLRECNFLIEFRDDNVVACKSLYKTFEGFDTYYKIKKSFVGTSKSAIDLKV